MAAVMPLDPERDRHVPGIRSPIPEAAATEAPDFEVDEGGDGEDVVVRFPGKPQRAQVRDHMENLADHEDVIDDLGTIVIDLMEKIDYDKTARIRRQEQYAEGLRRTGLGGEAPGGASFAGASKAVHPMLAEASVDFAASAGKEMLPANGPVKTKIEGVQDEQKLQIADRQFKLMNHQLTEEIAEFSDEMEQLLTQLPMGGSQYLKLWLDGTLGHPACQFVPIDDVLIPYSCTDFWMANRITHVQRLSESEWDDRVESEMYIDVDAGEADSENPDETAPAQANDRIEGASPSQVNIDGVRLVYEVNTYLRLEIDGGKRLPYLISICERTNKVCALYRNWEEKDRRQRRLHWMADFGFIPWRGAYKIGFPHLIGGLSAAATGALRALLDSALIATMPVLAKLKSSKFAGQSKTFDPNSAIDIDAGVGVTDIRAAMTPLQFPGPSPVLFNLLGWLTDAAKGVVTTAEEKISEATNNMPVGTALALIEQGSKVYSSIHARLHRSMKRVLQILARINAGDEELETRQKEDLGEVLATRQDFAQPLGVVPVSDPNIFSEGQRYAQAQLVESYAAKYPTLFNTYNVVKSALQLAKVPNIESILPEPKQPNETNAAAENSTVMLGQPILAFPDQDHAAHIETHMRFITDPLMGGNPAAVPVAWPPMVEHLKQHLSFLYAKTMYDMVSESLGQPVEALMKDPKNFPRIDAVIAAASLPAHDEITKRLGDLGPMMQTMLQKVAQIKQAPPMDPSQAALKVAGMEDARLREETEKKLGLDKAKLDEQARKDEADAFNKAEANRIAEEKVRGEQEQANAEAIADARNIDQQNQADIAQAEFDNQRAQGQDQHSRMMAEREHELSSGQQDHQQGMDVANFEHGQQQHADSQAQTEADRQQAAEQFQQSQEQPPGDEP